MEHWLPVAHVDGSIKHPEDQSLLIQLVAPLPCSCGRQTTSALIWPDEPGVYRMHPTCSACYQSYQAELVRLHDAAADDGTN